MMDADEGSDAPPRPSKGESFRTEESAASRDKSVPTLEEVARLERQSNLSGFDMQSLKKLSVVSQSYHSTGAAVNVTRTLSLDQRQWEKILSQPTLAVSSDDRAWETEGKEFSSETRAPVKFRSIFQLPMLNPFSKFALTWHMVMLIMDLTYTAFCVPIGVGFDVSDTAWTWAAVLDFTAGTVFMVDLVLGFHTGYVVSHNYKKRIVMEGKQVARWYMLRGSFLVDASSGVAWVTQIVLVGLTLMGNNQERIASQVQIIRILRLARLGRLFKVLFLSGAGQGLLPLIANNQKISATAGYFLQLLYAIAVTINLLGCFWYWIADREGIDGTWISQYAPYVREYGDADGVLNATVVREFISEPRLYLTSVYWAFTTVATVGYGDITPQTSLEQGVTIFAFCVGIIFFGVIIGSLTQLLQSASKDARKAQLYRDKMEHVDSWIRGRRFPMKLRRHIRDYYVQFWLRQADEADEAELLAELPNSLRTEALWSMARKSLTSAPVFADLPTPLLILLASTIQPRMFPPGRDVSVQGAPASKIMLLHFGQIVPVHNDIEGEVQHDSYLLNALGFLQDLQPKFQKNVRGYRTVTACGLWEWSIPQVLGLCRHHTGLYDHLVRNIITEIRHRSLQQPESFPANIADRLAEVQRRADERQATELRSLSLGEGDKWDRELVRASSQAPESRTGPLKRLHSLVSLRGIRRPSPFQSRSQNGEPGRWQAAHDASPLLSREELDPEEADVPGGAAVQEKRVSFVDTPGSTGGLRGDQDGERATEPSSREDQRTAEPSPQGGGGAASKRRLLDPGSGARQPETRLALFSGGDAAASADDDDDAQGGNESSGDEVDRDLEREQLSVSDLAASLTTIQDSLAELRSLVMRNSNLS